MDRLKNIRILFDLQAAQTQSSRDRGIGKYTRALFSAISSLCPVQDIYTLTSANAPQISRSILGTARNLSLPKLPNWGSKPNHLGGCTNSIDSTAYASAVCSINADIIHVSHLFEGFKERIAIPDPRLKAPGQVFSVMLYDLIPLRFQKHYFLDPEFKRWYLLHANLLHQFDLIFACSESSRQDAIDLLGIDPSRIVTIFGSASDCFLPSLDRNEVNKQLKQNYPLNEKMVLYVAGDDYRKNIKGAIEGFARLSKKVRKGTTLFIICKIQAESKKFYLKMAAQLGLEPHEIFFTGFVPEEDLIAFYRACDIFIFPSHYEGLGIPILEAMACGAPVLGGDNSSIRELIQCKEALFDSWSADAIAASLTKGLTDKKFAQQLRNRGLEHSKNYCWNRTAGLALDAMKEAVSQVRSVGVQSVLHGWVKRKRLAILSPLPPCRSGIASYIALFLPYLSRYFEIDIYVDQHQESDENISAIYTVFNVCEFEKVAASYDAILYEIGNSHFHTYMMPLLEKFPGIVVLHDGYLSGLFCCAFVSDFEEKVLAAHGPLARKYLASSQRYSDFIGQALVDLPCTKEIFKSAIGVIAHSFFNLEKAYHFYQEGWPTPCRIIPQPAPVKTPLSSEQVMHIRSELKIDPDAFVITTFGLISWMKWGDLLLESFLSLSLHKKQKIYLFFAGGSSGDGFNRKILKRIKRSGVKDYIKVTGYLSDSEYEKYLHVTNIAVQLRKSSRGGTPKCVLDCLACGTPVIVNNSASYKDYPDNVVVKLSPKPSKNELVQVLNKVIAHPEVLAKYVRCGSAYLRKHHDPNQCAAMYAAAIDEFIRRRRQSHPDWLSNTYAPYLKMCHNYSNTIKAIQSYHTQLTSFRYEKPRIFIDVSHIAQYDFRSGIQRVVKEITRALYLNCLGYEPIAVQLDSSKSRLIIAKEFLHSLGLLLPFETKDLGHEPINFRPGDYLFMLDSSWCDYASFCPIFENAKEKSVSIVTVVYDLLIFDFPECFVHGAFEWFERWFRNAASWSDRLLTISNSQKEVIKRYLKKHQLNQSNLTLDYWPLGVKSLECDDKKMKPQHSLQSMISCPYLLMVGTIEPRKSHALALHAMEQLWKKNLEIGLCISGRKHPLTSRLVNEIESHSLKNKTLFFIEQPIDDALHFLYKQAAGVLFLSLDEGFGLPLLEAAEYGTAILCSNIRVFREIAGEYATYIDLTDPVGVANQIEMWWNRYCSHDLPDTKKMPRLSWEESAQRLLQAITLT
ncbi:MAG: glycosyltransferase [Chlamydiota bacterium]